MKSFFRAMLGSIGFYSVKHFANSLGWPVTLVLMGARLISSDAFESQCVIHSRTFPTMMSCSPLKVWL